MERRPGSRPPTFWRETSGGESRWDGEKWPFIFDGNEREGELTVIQSAFHADPRLRISHTGSECGVLGGQWPLPTRPPEKRLSKKKDTLYLNDVWLPLRVKCSLHNWKHLPALRWFHYHYGSSCWCKGSTFPLNTFRWWNMGGGGLGTGSLFTFGLASATKSNHSILWMACLTRQ